jgi:hypothetical protein
MAGPIGIGIAVEAASIFNAGVFNNSAVPNKSGRYKII